MDGRYVGTAELDHVIWVWAVGADEVARVMLRFDADILVVQECARCRDDIYDQGLPARPRRYVL